MNKDTYTPMCAYCGKKPARKYKNTSKMSPYCSKECGCKAMGRKRGNDQPPARAVLTSNLATISFPAANFDWRDANYCPLG